jgi:hypothetical protein
MQRASRVRDEAALAHRRHARVMRGVGGGGGDRCRISVLKCERVGLGAWMLALMIGCRFQYCNAEKS